MTFKRKKGQNRTKNGINRIGLVLKIPFINADEWQIRINDTVLNDHERYLPLLIGRYCSYFINEIKPFYLIFTVKSH